MACEHAAAQQRAPAGLGRCWGAANRQPAARAQVEQKKAEFTQLVSHITDLCFDKCIAKPGGAQALPAAARPAPRQPPGLGAP